MKKYGLVVGISKYDDPEITDLSFAARDAEEVGQCLRDVCGFDLVRTLVTGGDKMPDHVNIVDALHNLAPLLSHEDLFLFYFAGHGVQTRTGAHLLTANSRIHMPQLASLSMAVLGECLGYMESAHRVLILDACRNDPHKGMGDTDNLLTHEFSRDIVTAAETPAEGTTPTTCLLFSCSEGERAYEWPDQEHGAFTHYLLEGIRGAAFDETNRLTVQALGRYVEEQVPRWAKKFKTPMPQTPWGQQLGSWHEIVLADTRASAEPGSQPSPRKGRIEIVEKPALHIETVPAGARVSVDGRAAGLAPVKLTLPTGQYRILAEKDGHKPWERQVGFDGLGDARLQIELETRIRPVEAFFPMRPEEAQEVQRAAADALGLPWTTELDCGKGVKLPMILVPAGRFLIGSPDDEEGRFQNEGPQHEVTIRRAFYMGTFPVTQAQWRTVMGTEPSHSKGDDMPVESVSWNDATEFCRRLSAREGQQCELPTEAQWEYACRAGSAGRFAFGDDDSILGQYAWYKDNSAWKPHRVGQKKPNAWGLHDMHGTVWEWCQDWCAEYCQEPVTDPPGPDSGVQRVIRGGGWRGIARYCRSAVRYGNTPGDHGVNVGFRLARATPSHLP
ncbi:MAG: SUMF1/EgtB/PvdO family nonheme iron enzyme [Sedimentisphaerales bacterium]|nr:SUMF1/EgtB/PvdO family nonheme iron enzyme [Sedimentisphaerales bacterium]